MSDPQTPFPQGTQFTYVATLAGTFFLSPDQIAAQVAANLAQDGISVTGSSVDTGTFASALFGSTIGGGEQFNLTLYCVDNNVTDVLLDAWQQCDAECESVTGSPNQSSAITTYTAPSTGLFSPGAVTTGAQTSAAPGVSAAPSFLSSLSTGQNSLIAIVVIVVVLIVAVILAPEHAARAVHAFA